MSAWSITAMSPSFRRRTSSFVRFPRRARPRCTTSRAVSARNSCALRALRARLRPVRRGAAMRQAESRRLSALVAQVEVLDVRERPGPFAAAVEQEPEVVRACGQWQRIFERNVAPLDEVQKRLVEGL